MKLTQWMVIIGKFSFHIELLVFIFIFIAWFFTYLIVTNEYTLQTNQTTAAFKSTDVNSSVEHFIHFCDNNGNKNSLFDRNNAHRSKLNILNWKKGFLFFGMWFAFFGIQLVASAFAIHSCNIQFSFFFHEKISAKVFVSMRNIFE